MKPALPRVPNTAIDKLSPAWIRQLIDCVAWAMTYPQGDGTTTFRTDTAISAVLPSGGTTSEPQKYNGMFLVVQDPKNEDKCMIIDGARPVTDETVDSEYVAGWTDCGDLNLTRLSLEEGMISLFIHDANTDPDKEADYQITAGYAAVAPPAPVYVRFLAYVYKNTAENGKTSYTIYQQWEGGMIYIGGEVFL